ncbi:DUF2163 domain-containing protein [Ponticoccus sp. SC2-23]|uniref:DUF2163 domain-containing protein n=1 Tax=Alexandriicola marinus TaxID=2081710 RepID=UPI000FDA434A|nr:DUF2163 domain-containing protein [Alexandriicola marinus]MBM1222562.1 DUF2163 domain-containing protein [Ponticoccus sp. SC6-9]MBM1227067.1 DUF2163 domain-containing protein [Ponticoccus sp. SC6-15]MBM1231488.1 DUF2163 domain-containing protein [Ponticoccus sp. SC6-38]MBM1236076.1 DUF2163 domain-containing protein [Ponticoccus sp. SC6-45]MBM1240511.1 DUF2163 domain-containing protein [Ponticoccus sp. SC6-49]MBM1245046.1 DUF2163 domain-containing protein [Ponticoccus sp. SC2-64]MBM1249550
MTALDTHLATGATSLCRCWAVIRRDGVALGFTDHDRNLAFEGIDFVADSGMTARSFVQGTGLSVDNSEALGVLSDSSITDAAIEQGRFDGAEVIFWLVNWRDPNLRSERFRGTLGEIRRGGGAFETELRGLAEPLNRPGGRVYQRMCSAILGDRACGFDLNSEGFSVDVVIEAAQRSQKFVIPAQSVLEERWFERGRLIVQSGAGAGLVGIVKTDITMPDGRRQIDLWDPIPATVVAGDAIRIEPGCDKRTQTCQNKFNNFINFQGFPHVPGEDWLIRIPVAAADAGGSGSA